MSSDKQVYSVRKMTEDETINQKTTNACASDPSLLDKLQAEDINITTNSSQQSSYHSTN